VAGQAEEPAGGGRKGFLLRLPPELLAELRAWAANDLRSLNSHIEYLLREAVRRRAGPSDPRKRGPRGEP
jgi:hypothetical protein